MAEELKPIAGMPELLRALARPLSVASNSSEGHVRHALRIVGAEDWFEGRIFSARQVPRPKPAPDVYLQALAQIGLPPEAVVVVEDSTAGVTAARAAGLEVIAFLGAAHIFEGHEARVLAAGASRLAHTPEALHEQLRAAGAA
jgi:HAD superfamily hydrolase (TIGR01509 family)